MERGVRVELKELFFAPAFPHLLNGELLRLAGNLLHVRDHLIEPLGLLGELGLVYELITVHTVFYGGFGSGGGRVFREI